MVYFFLVCTYTHGDTDANTDIDTPPHTHYLHGTDTEAPVNDKLTEGSRSLVAVSPMHHEQSAQMFKLSH